MCTVGNDLCPSLKKIEGTFSCFYRADKENGRLPHPFHLRWKKCLQIHSSYQNLTSPLRLNTSLKGTFERPTDQDIEIGKAKGITTEFPSVLPVDQIGVNLGALIRDHAGKPILSGGLNRRPRT